MIHPLPPLPKKKTDNKNQMVFFSSAFIDLYSKVQVVGKDRLV